MPVYQNHVEMKGHVAHNEKFMSLLAMRATTDSSYQELLDELLLLDKARFDHSAIS